VVTNILQVALDAKLLGRRHKQGFQHEINQYDILNLDDPKAEYMSTDTTQLNSTGVFRHVLDLKLNSTDLRAPSPVLSSRDPV
jgi:hypothetical protein